MDFRYLTIIQIADLTGKDPRTVRKRLEDLEPHEEFERGSTYDVQLALPLIYSSSTSEIEKKLLHSELEHEQEKVRKIKLENRVRSGQLVEIETIGKEIEKEYTAVKAALLSISTKLSNILSAITDPKIIKTEIDQAVNEALAELQADAKYAEQSIHGNDESDTSSTEGSTEDSETKAETQPGGMV